MPPLVASEVFVFPWMHPEEIPVGSSLRFPKLRGILKGRGLREEPVDWQCRVRTIVLRLACSGLLSEAGPSEISSLELPTKGREHRSIQMKVVTSSAGAASLIVLRFDVDPPFGSVGLLFLAICGLGQRPFSQGAYPACAFACRVVADSKEDSELSWISVVGGYRNFEAPYLFTIVVPSSFRACFGHPRFSESDANDLGFFYLLSVD